MTPSKMGFTIKKNLLVFSDDPMIGGVARHTSDLLKQLVKMLPDWNIHHCVVGKIGIDGHPFLVEQRNAGVTIHNIPIDIVNNFGETMNNVAPYADTITKVMPSLVLFEDSCPLSNMAGKEEAAQMRLPFICIEHLVEEYLAEKFKGKLDDVRRVYEKAQCCITVSDYSRKKLIEYFGAPPEKTKVITNGVDPKFFEASIKPPGSRFTVLTVGRPEHAKGFDIWLEAVSEVAKDPMYGSMDFIWMGGQQGDFPEDYFEKHPHTLDSVRWMPYGDTDDVLNKVNAFCLPSRYEGMPYAALEAIAKGVPCLFSEACHIEEILSLDIVVSSDKDALVYGLYPKKGRGMFVFRSGLDEIGQLSEALKILHRENNKGERFESQIERERAFAALSLLEMSKRYCDIIEKVKLNSELRHAITSTNVDYIDMSAAFPFVKPGDVNSIQWEYFNKDYDAPFFIDARFPDAGLMDCDELKLLQECVKSVKKYGFRPDVLEIGSFIGWSTLHLLATKATVFSVDPCFGAAWQTIQISIQVAGCPRENSYLIQGFSPKALDRLLGTHMFDMIFIDGDHRDGAPLADAQAAFELLKPGGIMVFHDVRCPAVREAVAWVENQRDCLCQIYGTRQWMAIVAKDYEKYDFPEFDWSKVGTITEGNRVAINRLLNSVGALYPDELDRPIEIDAKTLTGIEATKYISAPVVLFCYNRPEHTRLVCEAIVRSENVGKVLIHMDGDASNLSPESQEVVKVVDEVLKNIPHRRWLFSGEHLGVMRSVPAGMKWVFEDCGFESAIFLEDDVVPGPDFFRFMDECLTRYKDNLAIMHVSGSNFQYGVKAYDDLSYGVSIYPHVWGWGTWERVWEGYDPLMADFHSWSMKDLMPWAKKSARKVWKKIFKNTIEQEDTWDYPWTYHIWKNDGRCITPNANLTTNIGWDGSGAHQTTEEIASILMLPCEPLGEIKHPDRIGVALQTLLGVNAEADRWYQKAIVEMNVPKIMERIAKQNELLYPTSDEIQYALRSPGIFKSETDRVQYCAEASKLLDWVANNPTHSQIKPIREEMLNYLNMIPFYGLERNILGVMTARAEEIAQQMQSLYPDLKLDYDEADYGRTQAKDERRNRPFRLGILAQNYCSDSETRAIMPYALLDEQRIIRDGDEYETVSVYAYCLKSEPNHHLEQRVRDAVSHFVVLEGGMDEKIHAIRSHDLDAILIGTNITAVTHEVAYLASARLAHYMFVDRNSPVTTGYSTITGYITSDLLRKDSQGQYCEKLITLEDAPAQIFHIDDVTPEAFDLHKQLDIPEDAFILVSNANFYKINQPLMKAWLDILERSPSAYLVLNPFGPNWSNEYDTESFLRFVKDQMGGTEQGDMRARVLCQPFSSKGHLLHLLMESSLYLDSFPFSGVTSLMDALICNLPILTKRGRLDRTCTGSMISKAYYGEESHKLITNSIEEYIDRGVQYVNDEEFRNSILQESRNPPEAYKLWNKNILQFLGRLLTPMS